MRKYFNIQFPNFLVSPIQKGHPWGFSKKFQKFLKHVPKNHFLRIQTLDKKFIALAFYTPNEFAILKVFWYKEYFDLNEFYHFLENRIRKRDLLFKTTNSIRLIHGENDQVPSLTVDLHNTTLIVRVYSSSLIYFGRYVQILIRKILKLNYNIPVENVLLQIPNRSSSFVNNNKRIRIWYGNLPKRISISENGIEYFINPQDQKGGIYNDIRNLRSFILQNPNLFPKGKALNLFANNGFLSKILEKIGILEIYSIEDSVRSIEIAKENLNKKIHKIIKLNIFNNISKYLDILKFQFGTIIIDPPSLTSSEKDKQKARNLYSKLISQTLPFLEQNGIFILCSCSNRIHEQDFERIARETFRKLQIPMKSISKLKPELDHPTKEEFPEGKYFKVHIYQKKS